MVGLWLDEYTPSHKSREWQLRRLGVIGRELGASSCHHLPPRPPVSVEEDSRGPLPPLVQEMTKRASQHETGGAKQGSAGRRTWGEWPVSSLLGPSAQFHRHAVTRVCPGSGAAARPRSEPRGPSFLFLVLTAPSLTGPAVGPSVPMPSTSQPDSDRKVAPTSARGEAGAAVVWGWPGNNSRETSHCGRERQRHSTRGPRRERRGGGG